MAKIYVDGSSKEDRPTDEIIDPSELLEKTMLILQREIKNLMTASAKGKLESAAAKDLVQYIEMLNEIEERQRMAAAGMTQEELEAYDKAERKERNRERMRQNKMGKNANKSESREAGDASQRDNSEE